MEIRIRDQIKELKRELAMRQHVYPKRVLQMKMAQKTADYQIACLRATIRILEHLDRHQGKQARLL